MQMFRKMINESILKRMDTLMDTGENDERCRKIRTYCRAIL